MILGFRKPTIFLIIAATAAVSCSKSSKSGSTDSQTVAGVTASDGNVISLTGHLNLNTSLLGSDRQILYFSLLGGEIMQAPTKVSVDDSGAFSVDVSMKNDKLTTVKSALEQSPIPHDPLKAAFPQYASEIDSMSDDQLRSNLNEFVTQMESQGGPQYILVSYIPGGSALDEAKTFQFIGLPTSGKNDVILIPGDSVKGNLSLGLIGGSGDKATAELKADSDVFTLDDTGIAQLASIGQTLKVVKNFWVNKSGDDISTSNAAEPFFMWQGSFSNLNAGSTPDQLSYTGYGTYVSVENSSVNFEALCPASGTPTQSITFLPPGDVTWGVMGNDGAISNPRTINASSPFNNGQTSRLDQNGKSVCNGSATGFYARDDGNSSYMLNWGTGGSIQGVIPSGFWELKLDTTTLGYHDLSAAYPIDDDGHSKVLMPAVSLTKNGDNLTGMSVDWYVYNTATSTYTLVEDMGLFKKMGSEFSASLSIGNGSGSDERRGVIGNSSENEIDVSWAESKMVVSIPASYQLPVGGLWGESGKIGGIRISYKIGATTYNFGFRQ